MAAYQRILVCLDLDPNSGQTLSRAAMLAQACGARLEAIHVVEHHAPMDLDYGLGGLPGIELDLPALLKGARERLDGLMNEAGLGETPREVLAGMAHLEIPRLAEERGVDLIVMGAHARRGLERLLGSTTRAVLNHAPCDVLAVRLEKQPQP
ncbi:universal stress protein [Thioalkalivibrio sulfidiphilus]|uniref:universal stress protein n=1 Tax=Thioalkalivibrio sulfidiphilus TaxID=1033854 RepID=UPI00037C4996|nr:universal stress protein [Thioalkalivibrio sulfidiphilus]